MLNCGPHAVKVMQYVLHLVPMSVSSKTKPLWYIKGLHQLLSYTHACIARLCRNNDRIEVSEVDKDYFSKAWDTLTKTGSSLSAELKKYQANRLTYAPPLKDWVAAAVDRDYIHITRALGVEPDLYRETTYILNVLALHVHPSSLTSDKAWRRSMVLQWLAEVDPKGPWRLLQEDAEGLLPGLVFMLQHVQLFLPAKLLELLGIEVSATCSIDHFLDLGKD